MLKNEKSLKKSSSPRFHWNRTTRDAVNIVRKHRQLSRAQLAAEMKLTPSAMTLMIRSLLKAGILRTDEWVASPGKGRPQQMLKIGTSGFYSLGISVGFEIDIVLLNPAYEIVASDHVATRFRDENFNTQKGIEKVIQSIQKLLQKIPKDRLAGIGVSVMGDISADASVVISASDFFDLNRARLFFSKLKEAVDAPLHVINNMHVSALAERWLNPTLSHDASILYITKRMGIGIILEGHLYRGPEKWARTISHYQVNPKGDLCFCGNRGCLHLTALPDSISSRLAGLTWKDPARTLAVRQKHLDTLWNCYASGDPEVEKLIHQGLEDFSLVLKNLASIFKFDLLVWEPWEDQFSQDLIRRLEVASASWLDRLPNKHIQLPILGVLQQSVGAGIFAMESFMGNAM
ncbi:MAG: ROK family protein [Verrucomicrobiota bacterium]